ncbi:MAG: TIGR01906 family membrane protein [Desulfitobacteriia bacterium]|jgi:integral membrane protein (TIGR01906 family)
MSSRKNNTSSKTKAGWALSLLTLGGGFLLLIVIFLTSVNHSVFRLDFYRTEYIKMQSSAKVGISEQELMSSTEKLLAYIKGDLEDLRFKAVVKGTERQFLSEREIAHMVDVRDLYRQAMMVRNGGIALLIILFITTLWLAGKKFWRFWARGYLGAFVLCLGLAAILFWGMKSDFTTFWTNFHLLFFTNDLWRLDPATDVLIQMFPEQFFYNLAFRVLLSFSGVALFIAILAGIALKIIRTR